MKNIKLFEDFSNEPTFNEIVEKVIKFLDKSKGDLLASNKNRLLVKRAFDSVTLFEFYDFMNSLGYEIETYPKLSQSALDSRLAVSKINYTNPIGDLKYGLSLLIKSKAGEKRQKTCINIFEDSVNIVHLVNYYMEEILIRKINSDEIDMLFWNGSYLVEGEFEHSDTHREDGMVALDFESYETSDQKN